MRATNGVWAETSVEAELEAGENEVELKFVSTPVNVLVDCIKINRDNAYVYDLKMINRARLLQTRRLKC